MWRSLGEASRKRGGEVAVLSTVLRTLMPPTVVLVSNQAVHSHSSRARHNVAYCEACCRM